MPDFDYKHDDGAGASQVTPVTATDPAERRRVMENFFAPHITTPESLEVINGWLDEDNHDSTDDLTHRVVQKGTFLRAGQVGSNVAFDVFSDLFPREDFNSDYSDGADDTTDLIPVPGACTRFRVPDGWTVNRILLTWMLCWGTDLQLRLGSAPAMDEGLCAPAHLIIDGNRTVSTPHSQRRIAPETNYATTTHYHFSQLDQKWSGHAVLINGAEGWHTAGLYIGVSDARGFGPGGGTDIAQQARVRSKAMRYFIFRGEK